MDDYENDASMHVCSVQQSRGGTERSLNLILGTPEAGIVVGRGIVAGPLGIRVPSPPGPFFVQPLLCSTQYKCCVLVSIHTSGLQQLVQ